MPQFDTFSWLTVCFWTLITFLVFYIITLRWVFLPMVELFKTRTKLANGLSLAPGSLNGVSVKPRRCPDSFYKILV